MVYFQRKQVLEKDECRSTLVSPNLLLACLFMLSGNKNILDHILAMKTEDSIIILKSAQSNPRLQPTVRKLT
jgi:hypothetical protein